MDNSSGLSSSSLEVFKAKLDGVWSNLGWWNMSLAMREQNWMSFNSSIP